jgi:hypothetical protein
MCIGSILDGGHVRELKVTSVRLHWRFVSMMSVMNNTAAVWKKALAIWGSHILL